MLDDLKKARFPVETGLLLAFCFFSLRLCIGARWSAAGITELCAWPFFGFAAIVASSCVGWDERGWDDQLFFVPFLNQPWSWAMSFIIRSSSFRAQLRFTRATTNTDGSNEKDAAGVARASNGPAPWA